MLAAATAKTHVSNVLAKLRLPDRVQAVIFAYETGLVRPISDDLTAEVSFDRDTYLPTDSPTVRVTITNRTGRDLTVHAFCGGAGDGHEIDNTTEAWGPLRYDGTGWSTLRWPGSTGSRWWRAGSTRPSPGRRFGAEI